MYGMDGWNKPGGDLISIQDAIDLLDEQIAICNRALTNPSISMNDEFAVNVERNSLMAYRDKLECMPSAQPDTSYSDGYADGYKQGLIDAQPERKSPCANCQEFDCSGCDARMEVSE